MRTVVLFAVLLIVLGGCSSSTQKMQIFTDEERNIVEQLDDSNVASVAANGYRAVGTPHMHREGGEYRTTILFAKCPLGQGWQECANTTPTAEEPQFLINSQWSGAGASTRVKVTAIGKWRFDVDGTLLDCLTMANMDSFAVTQVPLALKEFIGPKNTPVLGIKKLDFPPNPNPNGPYGMGKNVAWQCHLP